MKEKLKSVFVRDKLLKTMIRFEMWRRGRLEDKLDRTYENLAHLYDILGKNRYS